MARAGELLLGGYVCVILAVEQKKSNSNKNMLVINFDIAEGDFKGFYMDKYKNATPRSDNDPIKWQGKYYQMLEGDNWESRFKGLITSIEESNEGYKWNDDEQSLKGKLFGGIFGEEEYIYNGEIRTNTKLRWIRSVDKIRNGEFEIPRKKEVPEEQKTTINAPFEQAFTPVREDDLPF